MKKNLALFLFAALATFACRPPISPLPEVQLGPVPPPPPPPALSYDVPPGWTEVEQAGINVIAYLERDADGAWVGIFMTDHAAASSAVTDAAIDARISYHCAPEIILTVPVSGSWAFSEIRGCEEGDAVAWAYAKRVGGELRLFRSYWPHEADADRIVFDAFIDSLEVR